MKKKCYSRGTDSVPALLTPHEAVLNRKGADIIGRGNIQKANAMGNMMESYQRGTSDVGRDDRADLLLDTENTFYGGGHAVPSPTPTPVPRRYQYGTTDVSRRGMDYTASPPAMTSGAQGFGGAPTASMGGTGNTSFNSIPTNGSSGNTQYFVPGSPGGYQPPSYGGTPTPAGTNPNINVTAGSKGTSPLSTPIPDLRYADPNTLKQLDISNLIYSPQRGGYITAADEARNSSGMYYNRQIQGGASGNQTAAAYYNYIGGLPTQPVGTPALRQLYNATGTSPAAGPSFNSILGSPYKGPYGFGG